MQHVPYITRCRPNPDNDIQLSPSEDSIVLEVVKDGGVVSSLVINDLFSLRVTFRPDPNIQGTDLVCVTICNILASVLKYVMHSMLTLKKVYILFKSQITSIPKVIHRINIFALIERVLSCYTRLKTEVYVHLLMS
jgi:hypothetical protein